jgi:2-dehydropantoate 2-reductase
VRIAVVGAGAVGCYLGALLHERNHRVTLVGREDQVDAISGEGLCLRAPSGDMRRISIPASCTLSGPLDLVLLTVKSQDVIGACMVIRERVPGVPVLALQNGVQGDHLAALVLGRQAIVGGVVMCAATYLQPGMVSIEFPGWLIVGEPFGPDGPRTRVIVSLLREVIPTYLTRHLPAVRWSKLLSNLNNAFSAATGLFLTDILRTPAVRTLPVLTMREGLNAIHDVGIRLDHGLYGLAPWGGARDRRTALIAVLQGMMAPMLATLPVPAATTVLRLASQGQLRRLPIRGSTWQSLARGKPSEIDYLNGEIVRLGERLGRPMPYNSHLVRQVHAVETTQHFVPVADLMPENSRAEAQQEPGGTYAQ